MAIRFDKPQLVAFLIVVAAAAYGNYQAWQSGQNADKSATRADEIAVDAGHAASDAKVAANQAKQAIREVKREGRRRRDNTCQGSEGQHLQEIIDLRRTYKFYSDPPPEFAGLLQNPLVIQNLREDLRNAKQDDDRFGVFVPAYCDEPGIGRKEPDPIIPKPPASVRPLLR